MVTLIAIIIEPNRIKTLTAVLLISRIEKFDGLVSNWIKNQELVKQKLLRLKKLALVCQNTKQEPDDSEIKVPFDWPQHGEIKFEGVCTRYSPS